jgi:hypothetical protein
MAIALIPILPSLLLPHIPVYHLNLIFPSYPIQIFFSSTPLTLFSPYLSFSTFSSSPPSSPPSSPLPQMCVVESSRGIMVQQGGLKACCATAMSEGVPVSHCDVMCCGVWCGVVWCGAVQYFPYFSFVSPSVLPSHPPSNPPLSSHSLHVSPPPPPPSLFSLLSSSLRRMSGVKPPMQ